MLINTYLKISQCYESVFRELPSASQMRLQITSKQKFVLSRHVMPFFLGVNAFYLEKNVVGNVHKIECTVSDGKACGVESGDLLFILKMS